MYRVDNVFGIVRCLVANADEAPAYVFEMRLPFGVVFGALGKIMHASIYLDCDTRPSDGEVHLVSSDFMLTHDANAFVAQRAQHLPRAVFAACHAAAVAGCFRARLISQAPAMIMGIESSMPMVTTPRSASGMCASGSRTVSRIARKTP